MLPPATDWHGFHNFRITFHSLSGTSLLSPHGLLCPSLGERRFAALPTAHDELSAVLMSGLQGDPC